MAGGQVAGAREYQGRGMATVLGAPISWVALFGALIGALSIVPMLFYLSGGGYVSAGMIIFAPLAGIVLGPWAGFVAALIGGLIGMFLSPASYPLFIIDANLSGSFIALFWGLAADRKYAKFFVPWAVFWILFVWIVPYRNALGVDAQFGTPSEPAYTLSWLWAYAGLALLIVNALAGGFLWRWARDPASDRVRLFLGVLGVSFIACTSWMVPWIGVYNWRLGFPIETANAVNYGAWIGYVVPIAVASSVVITLSIVALRRSGLRRMQNTLVEEDPS
jgi:predicted membrane protein